MSHPSYISVGHAETLVSIQPGVVSVPKELPTPELTAEATSLVNPAEITTTPPLKGEHVIVVNFGHGT